MSTQEMRPYLYRRHNVRYNPRINRIKIAEHLLLSELQCNCCCSVTVSPDFLMGFTLTRKEFDHPIIWSSAYRCALKHQEIYKKINDDRVSVGLRKIPVPKFSKHRSGEAGDTPSIVLQEKSILLKSPVRDGGVTIWKVVKEIECEDPVEFMYRLGWRGIGIQRMIVDEFNNVVVEGFTHLDARTTKRALWYYDATRKA